MNVFTGLLVIASAVATSEAGILVCLHGVHAELPAVVDPLAATAHIKQQPSGRKILPSCRCHANDDAAGACMVMAFMGAKGSVAAIACGQSFNAFT